MKEEEIIVRKPKFFGINRWRRLLPDNGAKIKLTWLPNPINAPSEKSAYIGMQGTVEDMNKMEGTFTLNCKTNERKF